MTEEIKDWGCPDWRDRDSYPDTNESLERWQWRWEFVRRFDRYRNTWDSLPPIPDIDPEDRWRNLRPHLDTEDTLFTQLLFSMRKIWNPCLNYTQLVGNPFQFQGGTQYKFPPRAYWEHYRHEGRSYQELYEALLNALETEGLLMGVDEWSSTDLIAFVRFDLTRPIDPQLAIAKAELKKDAFIKRAPPSGEGVRRNWPRHLRVIDAKDQGATHAEIANQFVEDGSVDEKMMYSTAGVESTQKSHHKATVSQWYKEAKGVMVQAAVSL